MAQSRLEKIGTIYTRVTSLIKSGAMKQENEPFWIKLYEAFPPKYEPCYSRPVSTTNIRQIFYAEDKIRAKFHQDYKYLCMVNLINNNYVSRTEQFIKIYNTIKQEDDSEDKVYQKAVEIFMTKLQTEKEAKAAVTLKPSHSKKSDTQEHPETKSDSTQELSSEDILKKYKPIRLNLKRLIEDNEEETELKTDNENIKKSE